MNRSALQFSLRVFFLAGIFCALFCVFCGYAMWFCWDLKNTCRLQISEIRYQRDKVGEEMSRHRHYLREVFAETRECARDAKMYCDAMQATRNPNAKFRIGQRASMTGDNCSRQVVIIGDYFDGTYLVAFNRAVVQVAEDSLTAEGGQ